MKWGEFKEELKQDDPVSREIIEEADAEARIVSTIIKQKIRNIQYLARVDRAAEQLYSGNGTVHELIEE